MDHFIVVGLVTWLLNGSEAEGDLVLIQKPQFVLMLALSHLHEKRREACIKAIKVTSSLACIHGQVPKQTTVKWAI